MSYYQVLAHGCQVLTQGIETHAPVSKPTHHGRKRARHPAGSEKGGEFVGDDPDTIENEAYVDDH